MIYTNVPLQDYGTLSIYYDRIFPLLDLCQWITHDSIDSSEDKKMNNILARREISLTVPNMGNDIYIRWLSFPNITIFKKKLLTGPQFPIKIDIGAQYNISVNKKEIFPQKFKPILKEFVLDIDMNDYDVVRTCCSEKVICKKCWRFMTLAIEILDLSFRDDFGFKYLLWVFSGRRGVHLWISDKNAMTLKNESRTAIIEYLNVIDESNTNRPVQLYNNITKETINHQVYTRAIDICSKYWPTILNEQNIFSKPINESKGEFGHRKILKKFIEPSTQGAVDNLFISFDAKVSDGSISESSYSISIWKSLEMMITSVQGKMGMMEFILYCTYPKLDVNVSKDIGHLLKSPFCIHPATSRICVPIPYSPTEQMEFDPMAVPTLQAVTKELGPEGDVSKTSIYKYLKYFSDHVQQIIEDKENNFVSK